MSVIKVSPEQLQDASGRLNGAAGVLEEKIGEIKGLLATLDSDWMGQRASAWLGHLQEWNGGAAQIQQALTGLAADIRAAGIGFSQADTPR